MEKDKAIPEKESLKQEINHIWDHSAPSYDSQYAHGLHSPAEKQAWLKALKELVGPVPAGKAPKLKIIDVGTGTGFLALLLAELGHDVYGYDLSEGMLEQARRKAKEQGLQVTFEVGDAEKLPVEADAADIVISRHLLWTLPDPQAAVADWKRAVRPGGQLIVIDGLWEAPGNFFQRVGKRAGSIVGQIQKERARIKELQSNALASEHAHTHDHEHSHVHDHANTTDSDSDHKHDHSQTLENSEGKPHVHPHTHEHEHDHAHDHAHDHDHSKGNSHSHAHDQTHSHDHLHSKDVHAHEHEHGYGHTHEAEHTHDHDHGHGHDHPAGTHDHSHAAGDSGHHYSPQLRSQLPATKFRSNEEIKALFDKNGLVETRFSDLPEVDKAEKAAMPFAQRLEKNATRHYVLRGKKEKTS